VSVICDGCKGEIVDGEHFMELGIVLRTAGELLIGPDGRESSFKPIAVDYAVINVHHPGCFDLYCYNDATIRDVFGR
jgi:hypothetical protein